MDTPLEFDRSENPQLARLLDHCRKLAADRDLPRADDFRPGDVRWAIGCISLVDVLDRGEDFRFRLFGSVCQNVFGTDLTGMKLSEIEHTGNFDGVRENYRAVIKSRRPVFNIAKLVWVNGKELMFKRLLVPFVDRQDEVCRILAAADAGMSNEDVVILRGLGLPVMKQTTADAA